MKNKWLKIICLFIVLLIAPFFIVPIYNNIRLNIFAQQLFQIELPPTTVLIRTDKEIGHWGGGNSLDFSCSLEVYSEFDRDELLQYYSAYTFCGANKEKGGDVTVHVSLKSELGYLEYSADDRNIYIIYLQASGYSTAFDIRGH